VSGSDKLPKSRIIPSVITSANLLFGFLSILWAMEGYMDEAAGFILLSVVMDTLDGKMARKLSASSDFGKELDSLSDLVSFGVAPAVLAYASGMYLKIGYGGVVIAALFVLCGAIRLARYNTMNVSSYFVGVPITFAGGFIALLMLFYKMIPWYVIPVCMLILSFLMVSRLRVNRFGK
jgi:CDP-diacylglycerol--serine O-phosphatidyltransferase